MNKSKSIFNKRNLLITAIVAISTIIFIGIGEKNGQYEFFEIIKSDFVEISEISGKIIPTQEIDLSFEISGRISAVNFDVGDQVKEGDIIARLDISEISSEIDEARANLESQRAKLSEIIGSYDDIETQTKKDSFNQVLVSVLKKVYISSDDIVKNAIDPFIDDPENRNRKFNIALGDYFLRKSIEEKRGELQTVLSEWKTFTENLDYKTVTITDANYVTNNLKLIEDILFTISSGSSEFNVVNDITQSQIDSYIASISSSRSSVAALFVDINRATEDIRSVSAEIPVLESNIINSEATVNRLLARKDKYQIRAPFSGIVTKKEIELGQVVSVSEVVVSMISEKSLEIESFIPEILIGGIDVGDTATVVFDAFGKDEIFDAFVSHVDPSETEKDGITTYKTTLEFLNSNKNIRSGMSVDIKIEKERLPNQIVIPRYLIKNNGSDYFVDILENNQVISRKVEFSRNDGRGNILINSGLNGTEKIIVPKSE